MLEGSDLVVLVRDTVVSDVEDHVGTLYELRHDELTSMMGAIVGGYLGALGAVGIALLTLDPATYDQSKLALAGAAILAAGVIGTLGQRKQIASLRAQTTSAKDLTVRLVGIYR